MHIVCPNCTTSYTVDPAKFSAEGRKVRCARCHEVWLARPQELPAAAMAGYEVDEARDDDFAPAPRHVDDTTWEETEAPHVESPSIAADWSEPAYEESLAADIGAHGKTSLKQRFGIGAQGRSIAAFLRPSDWARKVSKALPGVMTAPTACMILATLVFALIAWRADVVRLLPQTAAFFRMTGLGVNLRGLQFEDVKISTETVDDRPVLLIEGAINDVARKALEIPRLRFIVRDAKGADIYAWNAVLEQPVLQPGERAWFKTRLASPPAEGREIAVRFFHKLDVASGGN